MRISVIRFNFVAQPIFSHCPAARDHLFLYAIYCLSLMHCSHFALQLKSSISDSIAWTKGDCGAEVQQRLTLDIVVD